MKKLLIVALVFLSGCFEADMMRRVVDKENKISPELKRIQEQERYDNVISNDPVAADGQK